MMRALGVVVSLLLLSRPEPAEACTCCDWVSAKKPIGWSQDGKVLLLESTFRGCERVHELAEWTVDKPEPDGCYNLLEEPDKRVTCNTSGSSSTANAFEKKVQRSKVEKSYTKKAVPVPASNVRLKTKLAAGSQPGLQDSKYDVTVEVHSDKAWRVLWSGTMGESHSTTAKVWPTPKGDRAMLIITARRGERSGYDILHWVSLPVPGAAPAAAPAAAPKPAPAPASAPAAAKP